MAFWLTVKSRPASTTALSFAIGAPVTVKASEPAKAWVALGTMSPNACRQPIMPRAVALTCPRFKSVAARTPSVVKVVSVFWLVLLSAAAPPVSVKPSVCR